MAEEIDSPTHDIAASVDPSAGDLDQPASSAGTLDAVASAGMPGLVLRTAHHNVRTLLREWNDVASAVMAAELEQFDLARSFYDDANHDWDQWQKGQIAVLPTQQRAAAHLKRLNSTVQGYGDIAAKLVASLHGTASSLVNGLEHLPFR